MNTANLISLHGGHSGQYCNHAQDRLEDIIQRYIKLGFTIVGITEHIPPVNDRFLYPEEKALGLTAADLNHRFEAYFNELRLLQKKYAAHIKIFAGMETEAFSGYADHIHGLVTKFKPDYIVGSVHHVKDIGFDYSCSEYDRAAAMCGSYEALYEQYFDLQYEMINTIKPFVVGHFDLIRIYDKDYKKRILTPKIQQKIKRNLERIKAMGLVLDFNLRPLARGEEEPYITGSILKIARELGISVVPGDDSHGVNLVGGHVDRAIDILKEQGFSTLWPTPRLLG